MSIYRPEFAAALRLFARISEALAARSLPRPVLVGGAAVEFYSASAMMTGDFDLCSPVQSELEQEMQRHGFIKPSGAGKSTRGWIHPELKLGFEIVGSVPMDGLVRQDRLALIENYAEGDGFAILSVEDLIADRIGQYASGTAADRLEQAKTLFALHPSIDLPYLERRIQEETGGDHDLEILHGH